MPAGCLTPYVKTLHYVSPAFVEETQRYATGIKGFLCSYQIPLMYLFGTVFRGTMVEVGCWYGRTTSVLLRASEPHQIRLYCVDTFKGSEEHQAELAGRTFRGDFEMGLASRGLDNRATIIESTSVDAAAQFNESSLDCVWIDASHDYANVVADIQAWSPKIRPGGLLLGHDYPEPTDPNGGFEELTKAVNEKVRDDLGQFRDFGWFCGIWGAVKV